MKWHFLTAVSKVPIHQSVPLSNLLALCLLIAPVAHADQKVVSGNTGTLTATAQLNFNIAIAKYVMLRVGNADASMAAVTFTVKPSPVPGNSQIYASAIPPASATTVASTNPSGIGALTVSAYTNVAGTTLTCSLSLLPGATAFAAGTTAGGIPGTSSIVVTSGPSGTVQHPGSSLAACNGATTSPVTSLSAMTGTFTYAVTFASSSLAAGTYGNTVTYTATAP